MTYSGWRRICSPKWLVGVSILLVGCGPQTNPVARDESRPAVTESATLTTDVADMDASQGASRDGANPSTETGAAPVMPGTTDGSAAPAKRDADPNLDRPDSRIDSSAQISPAPSMPVTEVAGTVDQHPEAEAHSEQGEVVQAVAEIATAEPSESAPAAGAADPQPDDVIAAPPLFDGWPKPLCALVLTGRQHGYLEPCGCAGLDRQKGGLIRRYTLLQQLRAKDWKVVPIDAGNQVKRFGRQAELKFQMAMEGLRMMDYQAIGFGPDDLRLSAPELFAILASGGGDGDEGPFVAANVAVLDPSFTSDYRVVTAGGLKIGITAVLGARNQKRITSGDIALQDAKTTLEKVWPELQKQNCNVNILIAHATIEESIALGKLFPGFQIVVTTGGAGEPKFQPDRIPNTKTMLIEVGTKGMFAGVVGLFADTTNRIRYQRVPLDARFKDAPEMLRLLAAYQDQLKAIGFEGLGIRPQPHPTGLKFVGSKTCQDCHPKAYEIWAEGRDGHRAPHSHAYHTLLQPPKRANVPRNFDPECISCHVVGWNPQGYYPYVSGYVSAQETPDLINVGCEDCHGPGARHSAAENGDIDVTDEEMEKLQQSMSLPLEKAEQKCLECHDLDNSPDFQEKGAFERYWEKIKH